MRLAFNIEVREEREYLLNEEDSKKVMDKAFELAKERHHEDNEDYLSFYVECATQLLLANGEIEGLFVYSRTEEELTSVWEEEA